MRGMLVISMRGKQQQQQYSCGRSSAWGRQAALGLYIASLEGTDTFPKERRRKKKKRGKSK